MKLYQHYKEVRQLLKGVRILQAHAAAPDYVPVSLSLFSAKSRTAEEGKFSNYSLTLANSTGDHLWAKVLIDIYYKEDQRHPHGHFAYFGKRVFLPSRSSRVVDVFYDWSSTAVFGIDGLQLSPDDVWEGTCRKAGAYLFKALLVSENGDPLEELILAQQFRSAF